jgi:elongation factor P
MDTDTYDQIEIDKSRLKWELNFLRPQGNIMVTQYEGEILGIELPDKVELVVIEAEDAVKGDTATAAQKNAVVETGWQIKVPLFIKQGEIVVVSTADGKYCGRA